MDYANRSGRSPALATSAELQQHKADAELLERIQLEADAATLQHLEPRPTPQHQAAALKTKLEFTPTDEQQAAIDGALAFANGSSSGNFASLTGPAGTGKSTISRLVRQALVDAGFVVGLAAPTHKACAVLANACGVPKSETATFASLLALREKKVKDKVEFVRNWKAKPRIDEADFWLCDEASMLEPDLLGMIEKEADFWDRFLFIGDAAQLPPVNYGKVSPALRFDLNFSLTQVLRHDGAVLDAATTIRQTTGNIWRPNFTKTVIGDGSAIYAYDDKREWQHAILEMAAEDPLGLDPDGFRVLCFRRDEVSRLNTAIRRQVRGRNADPFIKGERLVTVEAIKDPADPNGPPLYGSSRELVIQAAGRDHWLHPTCTDKKPYLVWRLLVLAEGTDERPQLINVIDPTHEGKLAVALGELRADALNAHGEQGAWDPYWELRDSLAQVQPHWAMTVHKSQGSQFRHVFVNGPDLDTAPGARSQRRHLWYTAMTRAQQAVHLIADPEVRC